MSQQVSSLRKSFGTILGVTFERAVAGMRSIMSFEITGRRKGFVAVRAFVWSDSVMSFCMAV